MIIGAHSIIYSKDSDADRAFLKEVLGFPHVDVGGGWLIFGLPPGEVAVHPGDENDVHELYFMTDDVEDLVATMSARGIETAPITHQGWGALTHVTLPGGGKLGIYQPRHASPPPHEPARKKLAAKKAAPATKKKTAPKRPAAKKPAAKKAAPRRKRR
jgi:hypothetical protein